MSKKHRCLHCREYPGDESMIKTPVGRFCNASHALEYARKKREKAAEKQRKADRKVLKAKVDGSDRRKQLKDAQAAFNAFIRLRDKDMPCISCGRTHKGQIHAGHYRSVGAAPHLRFNQFNVWRQCAPCNTYLSGNLIEYRIRLVRRIGVEKLEWLEAQNEPLRLSLDDIKAIKVYYRDLVKRMRAEE